MKLENIVPSLELCKELKELGMPQEGLFRWTPIPKVVEGGAVETIGHKLIYFENQPTYGSKTFYVAPTVAELGEWLLMNIWTKDKQFPIEDDERIYCLTQDKLSQSWLLEYVWRDGRDIAVLSGASFEADTEANARAEMLIYLVKKGLISFEEEG